MFHLIRISVLLLFILVFSGRGNGTHLLGGDITWTCSGSGNYVFHLRIFRDCSGPAISTTGQSVRVWNHPTVTNIPLTFVAQNDLSPDCTPVSGGPGEIDCASGNPSALEEYLFVSAPVNLSGTPPAQGWAFTWDAFSRPVSDNLMAASTYGLTLRSIMYANGAANASPCFDSSPQFVDKPIYAVCAGQDITFVQNSFDPDQDSLVYEFGEPLDQIAAGTFNPPATPSTVPYLPGFSFSNPLPDQTMNAGNLPAVINSNSGDVSFRCFNSGKYNLVVKVRSFRNGVLLSEVYREIVLVVVNCGPNNPPTVTPPFNAGTSWSTTVIAGEHVNFTLTGIDNDLLQDGSPQTVYIFPSGNAFGAAFTDPNNGCQDPPCAVLNSAGPYLGIGSASIQFDWYTDCAHLVGGASQKTYQFNFRFQDDFCSVPALRDVAVSITILSPPAVDAVQLNCADVQPNGDVILSWTVPSDPYNNFDQYEIFNNGTQIATLPAIGTTSYLHVGADAHLGSQNYHIVTRSGCQNNQLRYSDTLSTMFLTVNNPGNGTAQLSWNSLWNGGTPPFSGYYHVYLEYPPGTWTMMDSVPFGQQFFVDTVAVCDDNLNYMIQVNSPAGCISRSSTDGEVFQDMIAPYSPDIAAVTVDTTNGNVILNWGPNPALDTEGYIILQNQGGSWVIIDTVWGYSNTSFTDPNANPDLMSEAYGIAAFDSCWSGNPASPNTSAMGTSHQTIFLQGDKDVCARTLDLNWTPYVNWGSGVNRYEVYISANGGSYVLETTTTSLSHQVSGINRNTTYCIVIRAVSNNGEESLSNKFCLFVHSPGVPSVNYLQAATVENGIVEVRALTDLTSNLSGLRLERSIDPGGPFNPISLVAPITNPTTLYDPGAETDVRSYYYRLVAIDSCGDDVLNSNLGRTIFLSTYPNNLKLINTVLWNDYSDWDGGVLEYRVYRSVSEVFDPTPVAVLPPTQKYYEDDVSQVIESDGEICYYVEAVENTNSYGFAEVSHSNIACNIMEPLIWVPNAFMLGGINNEFKPVIGFADITKYRMRIYNRFSEIMFETTDPNEGWTGLHENKLVSEGVYVWQMEIADGEGNQFEKYGFVTFLKGK